MADPPQMQPTRVAAGDEWMARHRQLAELALASGAMAPPNLLLQSRHLAFLPADALDLDLGDPAQCDFGDYQLLEKLGQGGMGVVYRARQRSLDREVALKLLAAGPWASSDFIERFRREAQSAARMQHPNIVSVYEIGSQDALNYFTMALVRGESLAQQLARDGPLANRDAAQLMRTVAESVDYAHRLGVLHLDLKPGNVLVDERGEPMVADFGLARRLDETLARDNDEVSGTPSYMAPEQAGVGLAKLSPATDIYGLGAILYECLCGRPPFVGSSPQATLRQVLSMDAEPLRTRRASVDADLDAICRRCLEKTPERRYPSARAVADDLTRYIEGRETSVRPLNALQQLSRWARREPRVAAALGAFLVALASGLFATAYQWRRAEVSSHDALELLWEGRREAALRLEQDGRGFHALPRLLDNLREQAGAAEARGQTADQQRVGVLLGQGATLIDRMVIADANPLALALSDDGRLLAVACNDLSVRWYASDSLAELGRVSLQGRPTSDSQPRAPMLLRFIDKQRLLVTLEWYANLVNPGSGDSWLVDLGRAAVIEPPEDFDQLADVSYSADGQYALLRNDERRAQLWQVAPWQPLSSLAAPTHDYLPWIVEPRGVVGYLTLTSRMLVLFPSGDLDVPRPLHLPSATGNSAWALSRDKRTLAIGGYDGRAWLYDSSSWNMQALPGGRGRMVSWLAWSEDDAWLATANADGSVQLFDRAGGDPQVAGALRHEFAVERVAVSRARRLLIATGEGDIALWRIPLPGPTAVPALRVGAGPTAHGLAGRYAVGWSFEAGLLASAGIDGQIRLWRLPSDPLLPARAAHQIPERTLFDGRTLVDVEWDRVRLVGIDGRPRSDWLQLAQQPGFAELIDSGRTLLLTLGASVQALDAETLAPRYPPTPLPNSPQRLLPLADGRVVLGFGERSDPRTNERLHLFDTARGELLGDGVLLHGPLRLLRSSADGERLLAVGPADAVTTLLSSADLSVLGEFPHDPSEPMQWADFTSDGRVLLARRAIDPRFGSDALLRWDPRDDSLTESHLAGRSRPLALAQLARGVFVAGSDRDQLLTDGDAPQPIEHAAAGEAIAALALSADGRLLARAFRNQVQLHDAISGASIGPPLQAGSNAIDLIAQLAFSPGADRLLARTLQGHWLVWNIAVDAATALAVGEDLKRVAGSQDQQRVLHVASPTESAQLRQRDPGPWPLWEARPQPPASGQTEYGEAVPARPPGLSPLLLDLSAHYEMVPQSVHNVYYRKRPTLRPYPVGLQRIGGVDYEIRGMTHIAQDRSWTADNAIHGVRRLDCLPLPTAQTEAVNLLTTISVRRPAPSGTLVATLRLRYREGEDVLLPIRAGLDVPGFAGQDQGVPLVYASDPAFLLRGLPASDGLVSIRLANPHPERSVRCFDLYASGADFALLLFAISVEPAARPAP